MQVSAVRELVLSSMECLHASCNCHATADEINNGHAGWV